MLMSKKTIRQLAMAGILGGASLLACPYTAMADSLQQAISQTTVSGMVGVLRFDYLQHSHSDYDTHSQGFGGDLVVHTGSIYGFSAAVGGYTGQSLGLYSNRHSHGYDSELYGDHYSIQTIRESYLQFQDKKLEVRFGRQLIQTPYANMDYYTFNPRAFMGVAGVANLIGNGPSGVDGKPLGLGDSTAKLAVFATRMFNWDSRYSSSFTSGNRYSGTLGTNGFIGFGARYQNNFGPTKVGAQLWYYDFYGYGRLIYGQADVAETVAPGQTVGASLQALTEGTSSDGGRIALFTNNQARKINAHIYGGKLSYTFPIGQVSIVGDYSPVEYNSFRHGGDIHPYNDNSGTIFTDSMHAGLSDMGPGVAYGVTTLWHVMPHKLDLVANYLRYVVKYGYGLNTTSYTGSYGYPTGTYIPNQQIWALDVGAVYDMSSILKGLSLIERTDLTEAENRAGYPHYANPFFSSRFYFEYKF